MGRLALTTWALTVTHCVYFWDFADVYCFLLARMDPALLRERELFKKRALSTPAVEKRPASSESGSHKKKKPKTDKESSSKHSVGK